MNTRASSRFLASIALVSLAVALGWPTAGYAAVTIKAQWVKGTFNGLDPTDGAWKKATESTVTLDTTITATGIPQLVPTSKYRYLKVKAIHNGADIFFRLQWTDSTQNASVGDTMLFADAVALEIPYGTNSSIAMGNQMQPVDILYWRADLGDPATGLGQPQNIVAGGAGTVQTSPESATLSTAFSQGYASGAWTVVMRRPLGGASSPSGDLATLSPGRSYRVTFAQWDGASEERNGVKLVAGTWQTLFVNN